mmetsp:Transcript_22596/g.32352  ORF Transcript_22596/g.32352 Transcript_22596/m.32352 type:complete len:1303 (-) Transcript_22596:929-4837(-)|eukprot:CAMPEP_0172427706 /NCGR_PEP_ID=MMETSP1064-20121228/43167_1 /TAXON_ID=202472 /ORGANISM="Aulacoseira subarctica , Strain CCAP 1002/5" /LENGTH=1302 /DNA_ID=CAMNT_0013172055 /DNA_START=146 /DNA_END=4054 /DNA_ORIENTATION=+
MAKSGTESEKAGAHHDNKFHFAIDRGGTFTDVHAILPSGEEHVTKLLSVDPSNYPDAPTEGIRRVLAEFDSTNGPYERGVPLKTAMIGSIRMGTTVATNALLERNGARTGLVITKGFRDLLAIGNQSRPNIFDLTITTPEIIYERVIEVDERVMLDKFLSSDTSHLVEGRDAAIPLADASLFCESAKPAPTNGPRVLSVTGETYIQMRIPDLQDVRNQLQSLLDDGIHSLAIVFLHSFAFPDHEKIVGDLAKQMGFLDIALSSAVMPMVKMTSRGHTACAAAYLTPSIAEYLKTFKKGFDSGLKDIRLDFMTSDGGLTPVCSFLGHNAILSGPAAGVVGFSKTAYDAASPKPQPVIGFDMGGTSTDVSRYDGHLEHVFETTTAGVVVQAPQLDIHTVAAGGGSRLFLRRGLFVVGPESSGAHPGPVCYRKGGYLSVTDANLVLGRILPELFPFIFGPNEDQPLDLQASRDAFAQLANEPEAAGRTVEELAYGFLKVANEAMCRPIRNLTQMRGYDISKHCLACFGGAGPQHACAMAKTLGIERVKIHRFGGVLSAYGLSMADAVQEISEPTAEVYDGAKGKAGRDDRLNNLAEKAVSALTAQKYNKNEIHVERYLNMRFQGTDNTIMVQMGHTDNSETEFPYDDAFRTQFRREFGFELQGRDIVIDDYRVRAVVPGRNPSASKDIPSIGRPVSDMKRRVFFENGWEEVCIYMVDALQPGHVIQGPALIIQRISTVVIEIGCIARVTSGGDLDISVACSNSFTKTTASMNIASNSIDCIKADPVMLSIFGHRFMGIAEQMGKTLARTSVSVNIKERLDFSCALFTKDGGLVANAPHIPVHLGAMQAAVTFQVEYWNTRGREGIQEGDVMVSNHPQLAGGSHLPDITVITPVFYKGDIIFFVASRGHHADIGGISPGSMPPHSKALEDEGAMIIAFKLVKNGVFQEAGITEVLNSPGKISGNFGTRNLRDNLSDLKAQVAANNSGIRYLQELVEEQGLLKVQSYMKFIQMNAESAVRSMLREFAKKHGNKIHAVDYMDDGSPIELHVSMNETTGDAIFDFTGTGPQVLGNHNAPPAVTYSAIIYCMRSLIGEEIPLNQGCLAPITVTIPKFSLLNPSSDAAVVGGNVLTSQRIVDVVLKAFRACAASQGCMNNLTFGDESFGYYETIAGGAGAGPSWNGKSGIHTHCTNTRITDPEILERRYPVLLRQFSLRDGSGGNGLFRGGDGVVREIEALRPLTVSILSERRVLHPYGMEGGEHAMCGRNLIIKKNDIVLYIGGKCSTRIDTGDRIRIETPGGGGYGKQR